MKTTTPLTSIALAAAFLGFAGFAAAQGNQDRADADRAIECAPVSLDIYFRPNSAEISAPAQTLIDTTIAELDGCPVTRILTESRAGEIRDPVEAAALSDARALAVLEALQTTGVTLQAPVAGFAAEASTRAPENRTLPSQRAVTVTIEMAQNGSI